MTDPLLGELRGEAPGRVEGAGRVLPLPLAADQQQQDPRAQPVEMIAVQVLHVVGGIVEVDGVAGLAPADVRDLVDAAQAEGEREEIGVLEGEVGRVVGPERAACDDDLAGAGAVLVDPGRGSLRDPALVRLVVARPFLQRQIVGAPTPRIAAVDAVDLHPPRVDERSDGVEHAGLLEVPAVTELRGEHEQRPAVVAVGDQPRFSDLLVAAD